jgi:alkanesulfonate monooxygenase SsuD/methylene tetrahydromethanopterin reductase-like flavin-dependent oxidoreductase (luciferase family)
VQEPRPPLLVGGKGGPRMLKLAVSLADGWNTVWRWTPEAYAERAAAVRETCERQARDPSTFRLSLGLFTIVGEDDADVVRRYELMRERLPAGVVDAVPLDELRQDGLVGTPAEVLDRLERFAMLGVSELVVSPAPLWFALPDPSMLDVLAERVLPAARAL